MKGVTFVSVTEAGLRKSVERRPRSAPSVAPAIGARVDVRKRLSESSPPGHRPILSEWLKGQVAHVLRITPPDTVDLKAPLTSLGLDSLMAMELRSSVHAAFRVDIELGTYSRGRRPKSGRTRSWAG